MLSYTVVSGDTLGAIAASFGLTLAQILTSNPGITNPDMIYVGQVVMIPPDTATPSAAATALANKGSLSQSVVVLPASGASTASAGGGVMDQITAILQDKTKLVMILAALAAAYYFFTMDKPKKQLPIN